MKIGVVADSHRNEGDLYLVAEKFREEKIDIVIHLGDNYDDGDILEEELNIPLFRVRGNNDFGIGSTMQKLIAGEVSILITHGHLSRVNFGHDFIKKQAKDMGCSCVCFGHTHRPLNIIEENILLFNPGSLSYPRGGSCASYGIITINGKDISALVKKI